MQVLVYTLQRHHSMHALSIKLRKLMGDVNDVAATIEDVPTGDYLSAVDQVWYTGEVLQKLADSAAAGVFNDSAEFIFDTHDIILNTAITQLYPNTKTTDIRDLL